MKRYLYYLIFINLIVNVIVFVPDVLIADRFKGALPAIALAVPIGMTLLYLFVTSFQVFPGKGMPEIVSLHFPKRFAVPFIGVTSFIWYSAGALTLIAFAKIANSYINQEMPETLTVFLFIVVVLYVIPMNTKSVLYGIEVLIMLNVPLIIFIFYHLISYEHLELAAVTEVMTHFNSLPTFSSISAATYIFTGYLNLVIFNRVFGKNQLQTKYLWVVALVGLGSLIVSFFLPIAMHGTQGVSDYRYAWIATVDSISIEFFVVDRVLFPFLLLYISFSIISAVVHWHVSLELAKSCFKQVHRAIGSKGQWVILACYIPFPLIGTEFISDQLLIKLAFVWLNARLIYEIFVVAIIKIAATREVRK